MTPFTCVFKFNDKVDLDEAEATLHVALLAAEGMYGEPAVRLGVRYDRDDVDRAIEVAGDADIAKRVTEICAQFLIKEFGAVAFTVSRGTGVAEPPLAVTT